MADLFHSSLFADGLFDDELWFATGGVSPDPDPDPEPSDGPLWADGLWADGLWEDGLWGDEDDETPEPDPDLNQWTRVTPPTTIWTQVA